MIPLGKSRWLWLAILPMLFVVASAAAQELPVAYEGKISSLQVADISGNHYEWKIYTNNALTSEASLLEAAFKNGNKGARVYVEWKKRGDYFYTVTAFGPTGCTNLKVGKIKVIPILIEAIAAKDTTIGACQSVKLDGSKSTGSIISYQWSMVDHYGILNSPNGMTTDFNISPSYPGSLPAYFRVRLLVTDKLGNTASDTVSITIDQTPKADVYISGKLEKDGTILVDGTASVGTGLHYHWFTIDGKIIGENSQPVVALNGVGTYSLKITDLYGCTSVKIFRFPLIANVLIANQDYARTSWSQDIRIPVLDNDIDSDHDIKPGSVRIMDNPKRGVVVVNADGTITYGSNINKPGTDQFIYEVCDSVGLCDSAIVLIDIYDAGLKIPEAFSPNGDGLNEFLIFKGLENYPKSQIYVYTRSGQLVYQSEDYLNDWDARTIKSNMSNKELVSTATYYYVLKLGGTTRIIKGFVYIAY